MGLGRASWQGTQGHCPTTSTASLPVLARRFLADPHEIGRFEGIGPDLCEVGSGVDQGQRRPRAGHSRRLWERLWERRLELGANTYRVLVHPTSTNVYGRQNHLRDVARGAVNLPRPAARHIVAPSQRRTRSELTMMSATLMLSPRPPSRSRDLASCPPSAQSGIEWSTVNFISLSDNRPRGRYALPTPQAPAWYRCRACPGCHRRRSVSSPAGCPWPQRSQRTTGHAQTA